MCKKKILYVDNEHSQIKNMKDLFEGEDLCMLYNFDSILCPIESKSWSEQKDFVLDEISNKNASVDILMLDLFLAGSPDKDALHGMPLSLAVADALKGESFKIVFVTGFTSKSNLLTQNDKWDDTRYLHRNKPKLILPLPRVDKGQCPAVQDKKCPKKNIGKCTYKDCFIMYMQMLYRGEL